MRSLLVICAVLVVILATVSINLRHKSQSYEQQLVELQAQLDQARDSTASSAQGTEQPRTLETPASPTAAVQPTHTPVVTASVSRPLTNVSVEARRADALMQSDRTAAARVRIWSSVLNLTPEQLQVLNEAATSELRRETEESLRIDSSAGPMDAQAAARLKVETISRQHETNLRILEKVTPHLNSEQSNRLREMFESWVSPRLAAARAEQEQAAISGN